MTIQKLIEFFSYYQKSTHKCTKCGLSPKFYYSGTHTPESIITLKCSCKTIERRISLFQLNQLKYPELYITSVLAKMVNEWNEA